MLKPHYQDLLTAYVDGELTARQRRLVARLLRRSGEARILLRQFRQDADRLRALPALSAPSDLSASVLEAIAQRRLKPVRRPRIAPAPVHFPAWTGMVAAAAVLLLVGLGSFLHYSHGPAHSIQVTTPRKEPQTDPAPRVVEKNIAKVESSQKPKDPPRTQDPPEEEPDPVTPVPPPVKENRQDKPPLDKNDQPTPIPPSVLTSGAKEDSGRIERVEVALPAFFKIHDLDGKETTQKLQGQLHTASAFRIELLCKDAARACDRLQAALTADKLTVLDPGAQARRKKTPRTERYVVFLENVTAQELARLLGRAGHLDRAPAGDKKSPEPRFEGTMVVKQMSRWDLRELSDLLGIDPIAHRPQPTARAIKIDPSRSLTKDTEAAAVAALDGKGVPRPAAANTALILTIPAGRIRPPELKRFLDGRQPAKPNTLQVFLVLRNVSL